MNRTLHIESETSVYQKVDHMFHMILCSYCQLIGPRSAVAIPKCIQRRNTIEFVLYVAFVVTETDREYTRAYFLYADK